MLFAVWIDVAACTTVILHFAFALGFVADTTVMVASPILLPVTFPFAVTVATSGLLDV